MFSIYITLLSANRYFYFFFSYLDAFYFLFLSNFLISLTRTSIIMLIRSDKSKPPCLMPDLRGKAFSFSPINYEVTCGLLIYAIYCVEIRCFYNNIVESFNCKWKLNFVKHLFCIYWNNHVFFFLFHFINVLHHLDWLTHVEPSLHPWDKPHLVMVHDPFNVFLNSVS